MCMTGVSDEGKLRSLLLWTDCTDGKSRQGSRSNLYQLFSNGVKQNELVCCSRYSLHYCKGSRSACCAERNYAINYRS